ncbi:hypothetical protein BV25DRAFT_1709486 [Artomyces pyxidatus]|uniref:Uncharacterized protein n=1 Tax=Artomyces pyxidatus TaxID=48021 RepID=A0ACB8TBN3_9AGAM|nr:hypothetical protein BV25DRAFT_1709486 [Artomyces pyxidatus]
MPMSWIGRSPPFLSALRHNSRPFLRFPSLIWSVLCGAKYSMTRPHERRNGTALFKHSQYCRLPLFLLCTTTSLVSLFSKSRPLSSLSIGPHENTLRENGHTAVSVATRRQERY